MKDLKEKHEEHKQKISLDKFLEHYWKNPSLEETKASFRRIASKPKTRLNVLQESRNKSKYKGRRMH